MACASEGQMEDGTLMPLTFENIAYASSSVAGWLHNETISRASMNG